MVGICLKSGEVVVEGDEALKVAQALTATTLKILRMLSSKSLDVSTIAREMGLSEAYISEQVRLLQDLELIQVNYERGKRGIRKICRSAVTKVTIVV